MWTKRILAWVGLLAWFAAVDCVDAGNLQNGRGLLMSVEDDAQVAEILVYIDEHGYWFDPAAEVVGQDLKPARLHDILPQTPVFFEYDYTPKGPFIRSIQVVPHVVPE